MLMDRALDPATEPARTALTTIARVPQQVDETLPPVSLAHVGAAPIFLHDYAGLAACSIAPD